MLVLSNNFKNLRIFLFIFSYRTCIIDHGNDNIQIYNLQFSKIYIQNEKR